jgi:RNA-splicing ligase RtcB
MTQWAKPPRRRGKPHHHRESLLDESLAAYKDIDALMAAQSDLIEIVHTLKQVLCLKG